MQEISQLIGTLGFPIAVCCWLLYERRTTQKELTKAVENFTETLIEIKTLIKEKI